jgi:hypothetical protein
MGKVSAQAGRANRAEAGPAGAGSVGALIVGRIVPPGEQFFCTGPSVRPVDVAPEALFDAEDFLLALAILCRCPLAHW